MAIMIALQHPHTTETKFVKVGWSWELFFLAPVFGIPLFRRKLYAWGWVFVAMNALAILGQLGGNDGQALLLIINIIAVVAMIIMGVKGNEITAKALLGRGWRFVEPNSEMTKYARMHWHIFDLPGTASQGDQSVLKGADL